MRRQLRAGLDDAEIWAQEYECEPMDTSNVLLPYDLLAFAEDAAATETMDDAFWQAAGTPVFCGIDFGRSNDPTVCWTLEQVGGVLWTREVLVLRDTETPAQVDLLRRRVRRATRVALDSTGPGVGLGDYLKKEFGQWLPAQHEFGRVELCTFTAGLKREMFPLLRRQFVAPTKLRIPVSRAIREDLHAMQQVVTNGEYNYWAPRTREGHSDRCTALALAVRWRACGTSAGIVNVEGNSDGRPIVGPDELCAAAAGGWLKGIWGSTVVAANPERKRLMFVSGKKIFVPRIGGVIESGSEVCASTRRVASH